MVRGKQWRERRYLPAEEWREVRGQRVGSQELAAGSMTSTPARRGRMLQTNGSPEKQRWKGQTVQLVSTAEGWGRSGQRPDSEGSGSECTDEASEVQLCALHLAQAPPRPLLWYNYLRALASSSTIPYSGPPHQCAVMVWMWNVSHRLMGLEGGMVWGMCGTFWTWGLAGGHQAIGVDSEGYRTNPTSSLAPWFFISIM